MRAHRAGRLLKDKIKSVRALEQIVARLKTGGKRVVFTNGCFDILHLGHARYLESARRKGDVLIVAVNSDASIKKIKGPSRPIIQERNRAGLLAALESVDYVVLFNEETPLAVIKALSPDILIKGADWSKDAIVGADFVKCRGGKVATIPLVRGLSTTTILKTIAKRCP